MKSKRCTCHLKKKIYCVNCSKIKMVICLKNGNDHLKVTASNGNTYNPTWYNFLKDNSKDMTQIIDKMHKRVMTHATYASAANVLLFYINGNRSHAVHKITL